jgi:hypothetical protein
MNIITYLLFKFSLLILLLQSMYAWFFWGKIFLYVIMFTTVPFSVIFAISKIDFLSFKKSNIILIVLLIIIQIYVVRDLNEYALILVILHAIVLSIVLLLKDQIKIDLLHFLTTAFATLLSISIFAWMLFLIRFPLPSYPIDYNNGEYFYNNYYFFLLNRSVTEAFLPIPRFSSIFLEPGHLGMITSFLLYANQFNFKRKEIWVILVATILTFSLAAYVLLIISAITFALLKSKNPMLNLLLMTGLLFALYSYFSSLDNGNNVVNNLIIERLQIEDGDISGNNRSSVELNNYFENFMKTDDNYFGLGFARFEQLFKGNGNSGYKVFILQHGLVGTVLLFLFYFTLVIYKSSKLSFMFLILYIFSFLQRAYALWDVELLIFITALPILSLNSNNKVNVKQN